MSIEFGGPGSGEHINLGTWDLPSGLTAMSLLFWCKFNSFSIGDARMFSKATGGGVQDHLVMFSGQDSTQMRVRLKTGGTTTTHYETASALNTDQWYHLGYVYDGINIIFYRDASQNGSSAKTGTINTSGSVETRIADNPGATRKELDGFVEDVKIWKRALSPSEVLGVLMGAPVIDGLINWWSLTEGSPGAAATGTDSVKDLVGGNPGTPASSPPYRTGMMSV